MITVSCLIIDDEASARSRIKNLLKNFPEVSCMAECEDGKSALPLIHQRRPNLIFMNTELRDMTGFDVLTRCHMVPKPKIIFISAFREHALRAFDFSASDYLLKPIKEERFKEAIKKVVKRIKDEKVVDFLGLKQEELNRKSVDKILPIKFSNKTVFLELSQILYVLASGYYIEIFTFDDRYLFRESLNHLSKKLGGGFYLIHRSSIINISQISELCHSDHGELYVKMVDQRMLRVSKSAKKEFLERIGVS